MRERVASTGSLGSVPFRSVSFRRQKTFLSSFVCPFAVHDPSVHDPFFVFVVESRLRARSVPALHCATRPRRRRSIDRSIMSKRSRLEVGIAATDRGVYEDDAETEDEPPSGDGDSFRDSFPFPAFISISISTRRREIDSISVSLVDSAAPTGERRRRFVFDRRRGTGRGRKD